MSRFRNDDTGEMCRQNEYLVRFGFHKYLSANTNIAKRDEKKKSIMASMRQIARLFKQFSTSLAHTSKLEDLTIKDMFKRKHFAVIKGIISDQASKPSESNLMLGFSRKKFGRFLSDKPLSKGNDEEAEEVRKCLSCFNFNWVGIFGDAELKAQTQRAETRKRENMPEKEDLKKIKDLTL